MCRCRNSGRHWSARCRGRRSGGVSSGRPLSPDEDARAPVFAQVEQIERVGVDRHQAGRADIENRGEIFAVAGPFPGAPEQRPREIAARGGAVLVVLETNRGGQRVAAILVLACGAPAGRRRVRAGLSSPPGCRCSPPATGRAGARDRSRPSRSPTGRPRPSCCRCSRRCGCGGGRRR